jgi:hypothetical protein
MKLLQCKKCRDVFSLRMVSKTCGCGHTSGRYTDKVNAIYSGEGIPLGFKNSSFEQAKRCQPKESWGEIFEAFVIPKESLAFKKEE